jgi:hypothetical protein
LLIRRNHDAGRFEQPFGVPLGESHADGGRRHPKDGNERQNLPRSDKQIIPADSVQPLQHPGT